MSDTRLSAVTLLGYTPVPGGGVHLAPPAAFPVRPTVDRRGRAGCPRSDDPSGVRHRLSTRPQILPVLGANCEIRVDNRRLTPMVTRFAPAPTGYLHLGHVLNAWYVWGLARERGGRVLLRIED